MGQSREGEEEGFGVPFVGGWPPEKEGSSYPLPAAAAVLPQLPSPISMC